MIVPWAIESPAGPIGGGGTEGLRYGGYCGDGFKSPGNVLLLKKQPSWVDGKRTPETTVLVPTAYPDRQVKWERSTYLLGQESPIDSGEMTERWAKRKIASEVQLVLLDQISERIKLRNKRRQEKCVSQVDTQVEPAKIEVTVNRPEYDLLVTVGTSETKIGLDSRAVRRLGLEALRRQRGETIKERELKIKRDLLQKKQRLETFKEVARGFTKNFMEVGRKMMELETGSPVEPESKENVGEDVSCQDKQPDLRLDVGEVERPMAMWNVDGDHGSKPSMIPKLEKRLWRPSNYKEPKLNRGSGLQFQVLKDLKMLKEGKEELRYDGELENGNRGSNGRKTTSAFVPDRDGRLSPVKCRVSKIPILCENLRPPNYSPPRKAENTGLRHVVARTSHEARNIKWTTLEFSSGKKCGASSSMNLNGQQGMQMHGIQVG